MHQFIPEGGVDRIPAYDKRSCEHYWVVAMAFHVAEPARYLEQPDGPMLFDKENLVMTTPLGCYHCEQPYSTRLAHRRCPGVAS